jgi:triacylglycerol lipase
MKTMSTPISKKCMNFSWAAVLNPGGASDFFTGDISEPMDVHAERYSPLNAWWLSELARLVYRKEADEIGFPVPGHGRRDFLARVGLSEVAFFNAGGVQAFFVASAHGSPSPFGVLAFRGTTGTWENWWSNFSVWTTPSPSGGRVHSGFLQKFDSIWPEIASVLDSWTAPLFFTGHSLGAALATLATARRRPAALYTFGSPRVGDADFAKTLQGIPIYRLYNPGDIFTFLPPANGPFRFRHVGEPIQHGDSDLPEPVFDGSGRSSDSPGLRKMMHPPQFLVEHAPVNYSVPLSLSHTAS